MSIWDLTGHYVWHEGLQTSFPCTSSVMSYSLDHAAFSCVWLGVVMHIPVQLQSSTETDPSTTTGARISCKACGRTKGEERGPLGWLSWEGNDLYVNSFILSEIKSHELWCSDPILSAGTRDSSMILAVELWPGIHFCLPLPWSSLTLFLFWLSASWPLHTTDV